MLKRMSFILFIILVKLNLVGCSNGKNVVPQKIELSGKFVLKGNEPFTKLIFKTGSKVIYEVTPGEMKKFLNYKNKGIIKISAESSPFTFKTADGKYKKEVLFIKNISIVDSK